MKPLRYERVDSAAAAVAAASTGARTRFLGGGTNLVDLMKLGVESPELLVDVTRAGLDRLHRDERGGVIIGAGLRNSDLAADPLIRSEYPLLSEALLAGASPQLRNMATVGGNLMQRTRCRYFQDIASACNKRAPGSGCPAITGEHHNLAVLGWSDHCIATHPSDMAVALAALDAEVNLHGPGGYRRLALDEFYRLPDERPELDTTAGPGELIVSVTLAPPAGGRSTYRKVRERASFAFALVSVAAAINLAPDGTIASVKLALGGVAHRPWRATRAEEALAGSPAQPSRFAAAIDRELDAARPLPGNRYKIGLVRNLVVDTLTRLASAGGPEAPW